MWEIDKAPEQNVKRERAKERRRCAWQGYGNRPCIEISFIPTQTHSGVHTF